MNFKSREDYQEHVEYCTDEMHGFLINSEPDYSYLMHLIRKPRTVRQKAGILREHYRDYHNGAYAVGRYARFTDIIKAEMERVKK